MFHIDCREYKIDNVPKKYKMFIDNYNYNHPLLPSNLFALKKENAFLSNR